MKSTITHVVAIVILALGSIFGLTAEEQNTLTQAFTAIGSAIVAIIPIAIHIIDKRKAKKSVNKATPTTPKA